MARSQKGRWGDGILHRRVVLSPAGSAGAAVATKTLSLPPGVLRFIAVDYTSQAATTDLAIKTLMTSGTAGTSLVTLTNLNTDLGPVAVGASGEDEAAGALAATDGSAGGQFSSNGLYFDVAEADPSVANAKDIVVDVWYEPLRYEVVSLSAQSGADGSGAVTRTIRTGPAVLRAFHIDYQNTPNTADVVFKANDTNGTTIYSRPNSQTDTTRPVPIGSPGAIDEAGNATAATDATDGGFPLKTGLFLSVAQTDAFTSGNEKTVVHLWFDQ